MRDRVEAGVGNVDNRNMAFGVGISLPFLLTMSFNYLAFVFKTHDGYITRNNIYPSNTNPGQLRGKHFKNHSAFPFRERYMILIMDGPIFV
jgi:hypothetical protein